VFILLSAKHKRNFHTASKVSWNDHYYKIKDRKKCAHVQGTAVVPTVTLMIGNWSVSIYCMYKRMLHKG